MNKTKIASFLVLLCLLGTTCVEAQVLKGKVVDDTQSPLADVYLLNARNGHHAHTDASGSFVLEGAEKGDTILLSLVSYEAKKYVVTEDHSDVKIILHKVHFHLSEVVVRSNVSHLNVISAIDLSVNPVTSSQELLRRVPGLIIGQHAGGGKAEQIFLRGFDIDHGTDINVTVDGVPVNMVSHAHGQGYADLHFLIPETVDKIDFDKGPYHASKGNMATAGYVAFRTKDRLENSLVTLEAGKFNTMRLMGMANLLNTESQSAYFATEFLNTDGYFEASQRFNRINLFGKYSGQLSERDQLSVTLSHLNSKWNASGQIPQRAIDQGLISRFGAIDSTEGGNTQRTNVILQHQHTINASQRVNTRFFYSRYQFELFSNFTFFLNDPVNGDQIRQSEKRDLFGLESVLTNQYTIGRSSIQWQHAVGLRYDRTQDSELSHTLNRKTLLEAIQLGDINETNAYVFSNAEIRRGKWLLNPALRLDHFVFDYVDHLSNNFSNPAARKTTISPKLNFMYTQNSRLQYFLKLGKGFHSNDTRVVTAQTGRSILPAAYGTDLGLTWKPMPKLLLTSAVWYLHLDQEFVYVGDEGVVEPGGKTERKGIDLGIRWQPAHYLMLHADATYTWARATEEPKEANRIPLAPRFTLAGGISFNHPSGFAGSLKVRHLGDRPATEDNSIIAAGYTIADMNLNYSFKKVTIGVIVDNILNKNWNETQFATESRLQNEPQSVTEIHFTPGTPFNIRGMISYRF